MQRPLAPVAVAFVLFGVFWGGWVVAAADVERELGLIHGWFGVLFSMALAGAAASNALGGALAERHGTKRTLSAALGLWALALVAGAAAGSPLLFGVAFVAVVSLGGVVDVVMNVAATSGLAGEPGKLVRFHAFFNGGAAAGAAIVGLATAAGVSWRWAWVLTALLSAGLGAALTRVTLPAGGRGSSVPLGGALALLRRERLGIIAIAFGVGALVEGGVELWGVLHLRTTAASGLAVGASSAVVGYLFSAAARGILGPVVGRRGAGVGVTIGASTAGLGIVILAVSTAPVIAGAGLVLAAGGISMCWPLMLALAAAGRDRPGATVGAMTSIGYLGFVIGPSLVGSLSGFLGLRAALVVLAGAAVFVAIAPAARRSPVAA